MVVEAICAAEKDTSGEIRVHVDDKCPGDPMERALYWFRKLKMHRTNLRNGVIFYLALEDRKFAILGDQGIDACTPDNFWQSIKEAMLPLLRDGMHAEALCLGIKLAGEKLKEHFPYQEKGDVNELSDEISFGS